jgi:penicillin amidase
MVYADIDGHIGLYAPGRIPLRKPENKVAGRAPVPGWDATYDWVGYIPFEDLPHRLDPESGAIATANNKIVDDGYPYHLTFDWDEPYRARRIAELLEQHEQHSPASFTAMLGDEVSMMARDLRRRTGRSR